MTRIIGHRGARNLWPENSLTGFRNLLELPVEGVEFDVHLTKAGELLVIHDPTLDRTTEGSGPVENLAAEARRSLRLKASQDGIPDLDSVLALFTDSDMELHIELKDSAEGRPYPGLAAKVLEAVGRRGLQDRSILTSFTPDVLAEIRRLSPTTQTLNSFHTPAAEAEGLEPALHTRNAVADLIAVEKSLLDKHWASIVALVPLDRLGVWVPNTEADLRYWLNRGLRQITTDDPVLALATRNSPAA